MSAREFHGRLKEAIAEQIQQREPVILKGSCKDLADYKYSSGVIVGLFLASEMADELYNKMAGE